MSIDIKQGIIDSCQGNPGALKVLCALAEKNYPDGFISRLLIALKLTGTKASNLWVVFKDISKYDLDKTRATLQEWFDGSNESLGKWLIDKGQYGEV